MTLSVIQGRRIRFGQTCLLTQAKCLDNGTVTLDVSILKIVEQSATLTYQFHESAFGRMIFTVGSHVVRQMGNTIGEQGHLALS